MKQKGLWFIFIFVLCCLSGCEFENPFLELLHYTVTFDAYDWELGTSTVTCIPGENVALPNPDPTKGGYIFGGWYTGKEGGGRQFTEKTPVNADITVYARWIREEDAVRVTFDADGGKPTPAPIIRARGETVVSLPDTPSRDDYVFGGWYTGKEGGGTPFTEKTPVNADITVYAKWVVYLRVTFDADGGAPTSTKICAPGATVRLPMSPTRAGYIFEGWYTEKEGGGKKFTSSTLVTADITVYAKWKPYPVVTFDADNGSPTSTVTCIPGENVALPSPDPTKGGYVFGGWYTEKKGGGTQLTESRVVTRDITVYAKWLTNRTMNGMLEGAGSIRFLNTGDMSLQKGTALTIVLSGSNIDWSGATWVVQVETEPVSITGTGASRIWAVPPNKVNGQYTVIVKVWIGSKPYVGDFPIMITD